MADIKAKVLALVAEIDPYELACLIAEAVMGKRRPSGLTAKQALKTQPPETQAVLLDAAERVARYVAECIDAGSRPS